MLKIYVSLRGWSIREMMNNSILAVLAGILFVVLLLIVKWRWSRSKAVKEVEYEEEREDCPPCKKTSMVHRLCPHHNVVQSYPVEQKDSLDDHLDVLTRKLAEKEGRLRLSKSKIRETQHEIENLHALDHDVRLRYREIMESLRTDLLTNEKECKKLQDQIEWVSRRRAELREEVRKGQRLYGEAAAELASNLAELQRGRGLVVTDKPQPQYSSGSLRHRKEPQLPKSTPVATQNECWLKTDSRESASSHDPARFPANCRLEASAPPAQHHASFTWDGLLDVSQQARFTSNRQGNLQNDYRLERSIPYGTGNMTTEQFYPGSFYYT